MATHPFQPGDAERLPAREAPATPPDDGALHQVVAESIAKLADDERLTWADHEPLLAVARRYRAAPLTPDPIAREMVEAVLIEFFQPSDATRAAGWRALAGRVSAALCEHATGRSRLERLWARLQTALAAGECFGGETKS